MPGSVASGTHCSITIKCTKHISMYFKLCFFYCGFHVCVVLYGCETWSLTLREERKLRVFENMVLRRIFRPRRDEVTGEWRRLHN